MEIKALSEAETGSVALVVPHGRGEAVPALLLCAPSLPRRWLGDAIYSLRVKRVWRFWSRPLAFYVCLGGVVIGGCLLTRRHRGLMERAGQAGTRWLGLAASSEDDVLWLDLADQPLFFNQHSLDLLLMGLGGATAGMAAGWLLGFLSR